tara:strand:+ start:4028 stop:4912 length:885 start_codon:yes stop_codon:yes gene_type:complete
MRIVELILADDEMTGIEAISVVENPAIEEDFIALKSEEIKLAEVDKERRILMGALLVPNKPIYRRKGDEEYYIYFSRETVERASQLYLMNGNQSKATLEHQHTINGLTLVESWLVEDEVHDKSRKYGLNVPVGTWMGAVKVNNDQIWNDFVKTGKVKGFSIEGYFADKMERPKEPINDLEMKAEEQLSTIRQIITEGERVELALIDGIERDLNKIYNDLQRADVALQKGAIEAENIGKNAILKVDSGFDSLEKAEQMAKELGVDIPEIKDLKQRFKKAESIAKEITKKATTAAK